MKKLEKTQDKQESRVNHKIQEKYYGYFIVKWFRERRWCKKSDAQENQVEGVQQREVKSLLITAQSNVIQNTTNNSCKSYGYQQSSIRTNNEISEETECSAGGTESNRKSHNHLKLILGGKHFVNNIANSEVRADSEE